MRFLLDTNVISEPLKPRPNAGLMDWLDQADEDSVFISVITISEVRYGIEKMAAGARRRRFDRWLQNDLATRFAGRILPVDLGVADECGRVMARSEASGRPISDRDAFIAATAQTHGLTLVTRNISDFEPTVSALLAPWS